MDVQDEQSDSVKNSKSMYKSFLIFYILQGIDVAKLLLTIKSADVYLLIIAFLSNGFNIISVSYTHLTLPTN